jgi:hypothetical protein
VFPTTGSRTPIRPSAVRTLTTHCVPGRNASNEGLREEMTVLSSRLGGWGATSLVTHSVVGMVPTQLVGATVTEVSTSPVVALVRTSPPPAVTVTRPTDNYGPTRTRSLILPGQARVQPQAGRGWGRAKAIKNPPNSTVAAAPTLIRLMDAPSEALILVDASSESEPDEKDCLMSTPTPELTSTSDATSRTRVKKQQHASVPLRRVRAVEGAGRLFSTPSRPALRAAACGGRPRPATPTDAV